MFGGVKQDAVVAEGLGCNEQNTGFVGTRDAAAEKY